jgi:hypothetical protein
LQEVCDQIDMLDAWLVAVIRSAQTAPFGGSAFLEIARPSLMHIRMGWDGRARMVTFIPRSNRGQTSKEPGSRTLNLAPTCYFSGRGGRI